MKAWTPFDSVTPLAKGEGILKSPALEAVTEVGQALTNEDKSLAKALGRTFESYMPGSGGIRFLYQDVPTYRRALGLGGPGRPDRSAIEETLKKMGID